MEHYERDYVEYLRQQIKRQAEMIDHQNGLIFKLLENKYGIENLYTASKGQTTPKAVI